MNLILAISKIIPAWCPALGLAITPAVAAAVAVVAASGILVLPKTLEMKIRMSRGFIVSAGALLLVTAVAKLVSASGHARVLQTADPIFAVPFRLVFEIVGALELLISLVCLFGSRVKLQASLVAWLATSFVCYRAALILAGSQPPCHCLGSLTGALPVSPEFVDTVMKWILAYLLIGSYVVLFGSWKHKEPNRLILTTPS